MASFVLTGIDWDQRGFSEGHASPDPTWLNLVRTAAADFDEYLAEVGG